MTAIGLAIRATIGSWIRVAGKHANPLYLDPLKHEHRFMANLWSRAHREQPRAHSGSGLSS